MLSDEAKARYIKSPYLCPHCGSSNIEGGDTYWNDPMTQDIECLDCHNTWLDVLNVIDIIED